MRQTVESFSNLPSFSPRPYMRREFPLRTAPDSGTDDADDAGRVYGYGAQVVQVGAERGRIVEHSAAVDHQLPIARILNAAANGGSGGESAVQDCHGPQPRPRAGPRVVNGASIVAGGVVGESAATDGQRPGLVGNSGAGEGAVAGQGAALYRHVPVRIDP